MPSSLDVNVTIKGPLFSKRIDDEVKGAILVEVFDKVDERVMRSSKRAKLGRKNNTLHTSRHSQSQMEELVIDSTLIWPRTTGRSWVSHNIGAIKKLAPNVIRKAGRRIAEGLGGR